MTRKSKRELERAVDGLDGGDGDPPKMILYQNPETGVLRDGAGAYPTVVREVLFHTFCVF